ncbi:MAG: hypothetical protein ACM32O_06395 [Clostridia bacterium]
MYTIFVEYKIDPDQREQYDRHIRSIPKEVEKRGGIGYRLLEGVEQPNTFVEAFEVEELSTYESIRSWRLSDEVLVQLVIGGAAKLHMWAFRPIDLQGVTT